MEERHVIVTYCRFHDDDRMKNMGNHAQMFPQHIINRIQKAREVYSRIEASHADSEHTRIVLFGEKEIEPLKEYAISIGLPADKIDLERCIDISSMAKGIWNKVRNNHPPPRIYFVVSNWQWVFVDPLISVKDESYRFYFEGAIDERHPEEIEKDKKMEKIAKIDLKEGKLSRILDKVGGNIAENLKG